MPEPSKDDRSDSRPWVLRSLASKFSILAAILVLWVVVTILAYNLRQDSFDLTKGLLAIAIVVLVSGIISRFTIRLLTRPLKLLQAGIASVRNGRLEPIQVSRTGDEIEFLGESFNSMIEALRASREEIREQQELLERRIRERTGQLEEALLRAQAANQAKSEFLANVSEELRAPINGIISILDIALEQHLAPEQMKELQGAQSCAFTLLSLLNDVLDLSKIEAGKMTLERVAFDVRAALEDCVKAHRANAEQNGIELHFSISPEVPRWIAGDPVRIRQIFSSLLYNAIRFAEQGSLNVGVGNESSESGGCRLRFQVQSSGAGIPADKLLAALDKVTQTGGGVQYGGTGLGLAIAQKLVEMQNGQFRVESELGSGSTVTVTLPCEIASPEMSIPTREPLPARPMSGAPGPARILVVEDNQVNQKVVTAVLRKRGYSIEMASDGREALSRLEKDGNFDLILMDVQMPILDGLEATRLIRKDQRWKALPIVAMTAHAMNGDKERCLEAGMNGYISKPVHASLLLSTVNEYLMSRSLL